MADQMTVLSDKVSKLNENVLTLTSLVSELNSNITKYTDTNDEKLTKLMVTINICCSRLDFIERNTVARSTESKRAIKTTAAVSLTTQDDDNESTVSSSAGSKKRVAKKSAAPTVDGDEKIVNTLTYFKKIVIFRNINGLREKYVTDTAIANAKIDSKKVVGTEAYWTAVGAYLWKTYTKEEKKAIKDEFIAWQSLTGSTAGSNQLNEDEVDE